MAKKSEVRSNCNVFIKKIQIQFQASIKNVCTDNGGKCIWLRISLMIMVLLNKLQSLTLPTKWVSVAQTSPHSQRGLCSSFSSKSFSFILGRLRPYYRLLNKSYHLFIT